VNLSRVAVEKLNTICKSIRRSQFTGVVYDFIRFDCVDFACSGPTSQQRKHTWPAAYFEEWKYFAPVFTEQKT